MAACRIVRVERDAPDERGERARGPAGRMWLVAVVSATLGAGVGGAAVHRVVAPPVATSPPRAEPSSAAPRAPSSGPLLAGVADVAEAVLPSVVRIEPDPRSGAPGNGSGVVYRADGHIVTNAHVVAGAAEVDVVLGDGERLPASVVGLDPRSDLGVLRVGRVDLAPVDLADPHAVRVGDVVVALGSPYGLEGTVTAGVVSALNRAIDVRGAGDGPVRLVDVLQTDAAVGPGASGGPLVDASGRMVGITSAVLVGPDGAGPDVGFAIPVATVVDVVEQLLETGHVRRAYLGLDGATLTRVAAEGLGVDRGALVERVATGGPAHAAGLRAGDVVVAAGDADVASFDDLLRVVSAAEIGEVLPIRYVRGGSERTVDVALGELQG